MKKMKQMIFFFYLSMIFISRLDIYSRVTLQKEFMKQIGVCGLSGLQKAFPSHFNIFVTCFSDFVNIDPYEPPISEMLSVYDFIVWKIYFCPVFSHPWAKLLPLGWILSCWLYFLMAKSFCFCFVFLSSQHEFIHNHECSMGWKGYSANNE